ncbi:Phosphatidylinositol-specific phospholipase C, Y domain protein, partial [Teladorsagia circumcincta]
MSYEAKQNGSHAGKAMIEETSNSSELALLAEEVVERQLCPEKEEHSTSDLSRIVNYLSADKVPHTWNVERRFFLMCSMSEDASIKIYKDSAQRQANNLIKHTSKRLVRVFPANMRITSDNFLPNIHWMMGVQMVALNFQTNCSEMLMNHAMFEQAANCGYVKKPDCLCDPSLDFDFYSSRVPYRMRVTLKITIVMSETAFLQICVSPASANGNQSSPAYYRILSINKLQNGT